MSDGERVPEQYLCADWMLTGRAEVFVWGRGEYGRLGLGDRSGSSKLRATQVSFREPDIQIVQVRSPLLPVHARKDIKATLCAAPLVLF